MTTTSISLLQGAAASNSADAWQRIFDIYMPMLRMWARRTGLSAEDATDVAQDVMATLAKELPGFEYDRGKGTFRGWLKTITNNRCRELLRRKRAILVSDADHISRVLKTLESPPVNDFWEAEYEQHLMRYALEIMQSDFEETTWRACYELTVSGRRAADIAQELGMTEGAVYIAKSRVLKRLRRILKEML